MVHAISTIPVDQNIFEKPSPNWKDKTATCLFTPMISAKRIIIGIVAAPFNYHSHGSLRLKLIYIVLPAQYK